MFNANLVRTVIESVSPILASVGFVPNGNWDTLRHDEDYVTIFAEHIRSHSWLYIYMYAPEWDVGDDFTKLGCEWEGECGTVFQGSIEDLMEYCRMKPTHVVRPRKRE
jgi:hypothetical protein